ncbi:MAG: hypothetical protein K0S71_1401 [Clostridia bacterium]|jgi:uncharacterized membrane protein YcaP (DUF421 family)|nr:hypothetical protein [Clostridia bacterium]
MRGEGNLNEIVIVLLRTALSFTIVLFFFRIMGKKELGELTLCDAIVSLMIAELAVIAIEDIKLSMIRGLAPVFMLIFLQEMVTIIGLKSRKFRELVEGRPVMIIEEGKINQENLKKNRYNLDDVLFQLRENGISDIREVEYAILERKGNLSIFTKDENPEHFTLPLIQDGDIQETNLKIIKKTEAWLLQELQKNGYDKTKDIFYCSYMNGEFFIDKKQSSK